MRKLNCNLLDEILSNKTTYLFLIVILLLSAFLRLYKLDKFLNFGYDQGKDALAIWDLLYQKNPFLVGPETPIEGIYRGPLYYYLVAPFYWIGKGSPVFVTAFLSWLSVGAILLIYCLASDIYNRKVGLLAAFFYGISYELVIFSRELSNQNASQIFFLLAIYFLFKAIKGNRNNLICASFVFGLALQFEYISIIFFLLTIIWAIIRDKRKFFIPNLLILTFLVFFITLVPQIIFDLRYRGILLTSFGKFFAAERANFNLNIFDFSFVSKRIIDYYEVFFKNLFPADKTLKLFSLGVFLYSLFFYRQKIFSHGGRLMLASLVIPLFCSLFYRGFHGYIWKNYFFSLTPSFIVLFSACFYYFSKRGIVSKTFLAILLLSFLGSNKLRFESFYKTGNGISLEAQLKAIDWIYKDAGSEKFNVDVYIPQNVFYPYTYLFRWYAKNKYGREPEEKRVKLLYTLSEPNSWSPELLQAWYRRQDGIGKITKAYSWGNITVERRQRIKFYD